MQRLLAQPRSYRFVLTPVEREDAGADTDGEASNLVEPPSREVATAASEAEPDPESAKPDKTIHMVDMRDGVTLATDVFLPTEGEGPWPVMFLRGPYGKNGYGHLLAGVGVRSGDGVRRAGHAGTLRVAGQ